MVSIWAKIGEAVKTSVKAIGGVVALIPKALIYPIKKPFASMDETKHDAKVSLKEAVNINVPEEEKEYDPPIKITKSSKYFGVQVTKQEKGEVTFLASRTLTGDIPYLSPEQLGEIKKLSKGRPSSLTLFREENRIVIEVDVKDIINKIKAAPEHKGKSQEEMKQLIIGKIYDEVNENLKGLAKITDGELKVHTDRKLLYGIAEKLYNEYDNQKQQSQEIIRSIGEEKSSEKISNNWQSKCGKQSYERIKSRE